MKVEYHNSVRLLAVIGNPIAHSLSPLLQNTMIRELGQSDLYLAVRVEKGGLTDFLTAARVMDISGFNLTMPHKIDILPFLSKETIEARRAGSVNSVRILDGKLEGHSTDGLGFRRALQDMGCGFSGQIVTLLGAGGAARSIAMTAVDSGAKQVRILNRTLQKAEDLCRGENHMLAAPLEAAEDLLPDTDLLINTTPVGMDGAGQAGAFPFLRALQAGAPAVDCIYAPALTPFMAEAERLGHPVRNGIGMLVYQAIYAYDFFRRLDLDEETVSHLGRLLLSASGVNPCGA